MHRFIYLFIFTFLFSLDTDWIEYGKHEISLNKIIIKVEDSKAPKLGQESPLNFSSLSQIANIKNYSNMKSMKPLFRNYESFTSNHYEYDLHQYYIISFINPETNIINICDEYIFSRYKIGRPFTR